MIARNALFLGPPRRFPSAAAPRNIRPLSQEPKTSHGNPPRNRPRGQRWPQTQLSCPTPSATPKAGPQVPLPPKQRRPNRRLVLVGPRLLVPDPVDATAFHETTQDPGNTCPLGLTRRNGLWRSMERCLTGQLSTQPEHPSHAVRPTEPAPSKGAGSERHTSLPAQPQSKKNG